MVLFSCFICSIITLFLTNAGLISYRNKYFQSYKTYHNIKNKIDNETSSLLFFISFIICLLFIYKGENSLLSILIVSTTISSVYIDYQYRVIPDILTLGMIWGALFINTVFGLSDINNQIQDIIIIYVTMNLINYALEKHTKKFGIGRGDIKFLVGVGACIGLFNSFLVLNMSILSRLIFKTKNYAFAPFLGVNYFIVIIAL